MQEFLSILYEPSKVEPHLEELKRWFDLDEAIGDDGNDSTNEHIPCPPILTSMKPYLSEFPSIAVAVVRAVTEADNRGAEPTTPPELTTEYLDSALHKISQVMRTKAPCKLSKKNFLALLKLELTKMSIEDLKRIIEEMLDMQSGKLVLRGGISRRCEVTLPTRVCQRIGIREDHCYSFMYPGKLL